MYTDRFGDAKQWTGAGAFRGRYNINVLFTWSKASDKCGRTLIITLYVDVICSICSGRNMSRGVHPRSVSTIVSRHTEVVASVNPF